MGAKARKKLGGVRPPPTATEAPKPGRIKASDAVAWALHYMAVALCERRPQRHLKLATKPEVGPVRMMPCEECVTLTVAEFGDLDIEILDLLRLAGDHESVSHHGKRRHGHQAQAKKRPAARQ